MAAKGMLIDVKRCMGCKACSIACKAENRFPGGVSATRIHERTVGSFPDVAKHLTKMACLHCKEPICVRVCPSGSLFQTPEGTVDQDRDACIGCGYCVVSCPFQAPRRLSGKAYKCTMCSDRLSRGEVPACVATCPTSALVYGDISDLDALAEQRVRSLSRRFPHSQVYVSHGPSATSVRYILHDRATAFGLPESPRAHEAVALWQDFVKPYGVWMIPLALMASAVSFITTRLSDRQGEKENSEEDR